MPLLLPPGYATECIWSSGEQFLWSVCNWSSGPPMSSPSVSSDLASSSSGPQQLVHIPLSPHLFSNIPSRNCSPLSNLFYLPVQSEIPWKTGKARFLTSTECVQSLKDKERKKQRKPCRRHCILRKGRKRKNRGKKNCAVKRKKWPERQQKEKQLWWKKKWPRVNEKLLNYK